MSFVKASKKSAKARVALIGPGGSGKTYTALKVAQGLGGPIALIDTERGSASKYAGDIADFDVCELARFSPADYVRELKAAAAAKYPVVIIDSLSHAWEGEGGILDQMDQRGGKFEGWKDMAPQTRLLIETILTYPGHVIATLRTKTEYVIEERESKGRMVKVPRKIGLAPKFKEGLEYEFDVVANMDAGILTVSKSRCSALADATIKHPGADFARALKEWLEDGTPAPVPVAATIAKAVEKHIKDCHDRDSLGDWCASKASTPENMRARLRAAIIQRCADIGVNVAELPIFLGAAGFDAAQERRDNIEAMQDAIRDET